jgi:hypothetical protein
MEGLCVLCHLVRHSLVRYKPGDQLFVRASLLDAFSHIPYLSGPADSDLGGELQVVGPKVWTCTHTSTCNRTLGLVCFPNADPFLECVVTFCNGRLRSGSLCMIPPEPLCTMHSARYTQGDVVFSVPCTSKDGVFAANWTIPSSSPGGEYAAKVPWYLPYSSWGRGRESRAFGMWSAPGWAGSSLLQFGLSLHSVACRGEWVQLLCCLCLRLAWLMPPPGSSPVSGRPFFRMRSDHSKSV